MKIEDVRRAYAMPLTSPSFPPGPYRFFDREYLIVTYRTDPKALRAVVPEPLEIVGTLHYGQALCALGTFGYKHRAAAKDAVLKSLRKPNFLLKVIPHVDGTPRICELVRYHLEDIVLKEAWNTPAELQLFRHITANVAQLPVLEIVSGQHLVADLTLGLGQVAFDYLAEDTGRAVARHPKPQGELANV